MSQGYLYIMSAAGRWKVGLSNDPKRRLKELKNAATPDLKLHKSYPTDDMPRAEQLAHSRLKELQMGVSGEVFSGDIALIENIVSSAANLYRTLGVEIEKPVKPPAPTPEEIAALNAEKAAREKEETLRMVQSEISSACYYYHQVRHKNLQLPKEFEVELVRKLFADKEKCDLNYVNYRRHLISHSRWAVGKKFIEMAPEMFNDLPYRERQLEKYKHPIFKSAEEMEQKRSESRRQGEVSAARRKEIAQLAMQGR